MKWSKVTLACALVAAFAFYSARADVPFIRGDTNGDGSLDVVDACNILEYIFGYGPGPSCRDAWDANDEGLVNIADALKLLGAYCRNSGSIPPPLTNPGPDPTPDKLGCEEITVYEPIPEKAITIGLTDSTIPGGEEPWGVTTVWITSDRPLAGLQFKLRIEGIEDARFWVPKDVPYEFLQLCVDGATVSLLPDFACQKLIPPGQKIPLFDLPICLQEGTPAGTYRIIVEDARASVLEDLNAHLLQTSAAELKVQSPINVSTCDQPPGEPVEPPPEPLEPIEYHLKGPTMIPENAEELTYSLEVKSFRPVVSFDVALDFDESVLRLADVQKTLTVNASQVSVFDVVSDPGATVTEENTAERGYVALHIELGSEAQQAWELERAYKVADITFLVLDTESIYSWLTFRDVGPQSQYKNQVVCLLEGEEVVRSLIPKEELLLVPESFRLVENEEDVRVIYRLGEAGGFPGQGGIPVDFYLESNTALQGYAMAFTYDREILQAESVTSLLKVNGLEPDYVSSEIWTPEDPGAAHGVSLAVIGDLDARLMFFPDPEKPLARITFTILPDAPEETEALLKFDDECCGRPPVANVVVFNGYPVSPEVQPSQIRVTQLVNGRVKVLGEVSIFLRGDANADYRVDLADAVRILEYLFQGGRSVSCPDAADANDDGHINIADAICVLYALFSPEREIAAPYPEPGKDPTPDNLGPCYY